MGNLTNIMMPLTFEENPCEKFLRGFRSTRRRGIALCFSDMEDYTEGYSVDDECPQCENGNVTIRRGDIYEDGEKKNYEYAQCSKCSWNTAP
jgi:hypothetical protein